MRILGQLDVLARLVPEADRRAIQASVASGDRVAIYYRPGARGRAVLTGRYRAYRVPPRSFGGPPPLALAGVVEITDDGEALCPA